MMTASDDKKTRKKALAAKNRKQQEMFQAFKLMRAESERVQESQTPPEHSAPAAAIAWGDKVAIIRNRLTDKKRASKERWNRFAGTGGEGGRGL